MKYLSILTKYAILTGAQANKKAIGRYGTTSDPSSIGYITPSGVCIDSSGRAVGSGFSGRNIDHREIATYALEGHYNFNLLFETLNFFIFLTGNIRVVSATEELNIQVPLKKGIPSSAQMATLKKLGANKNVNFDITDEKGRNLSSGNGAFYKFEMDLKILFSLY